MELMRSRTVFREPDARQNPRLAGEMCRGVFGVANQGTGRRGKHLFDQGMLMTDFDLGRRREICERSQKLLREPKLSLGCARGDVDRHNKRRAHHR